MSEKRSYTEFKYRCTSCDAEYNSRDIIYLCPACSKDNYAAAPPKGILKIVYDYGQIRRNNPDFDVLEQNNFSELLPLENIKSLPYLKIGNTPLYRITSLGAEKFQFSIYLKDDSQNPTFSFKDRASALVSAFAKERNIGTIVAASTGNAGSSLAGICASQNQKAVIFVPEKAPLAKLVQIIMYGATVIPVKGTYDDAFELSIKATQIYGCYNRNTAFNPLTIEGKKTVSFELFRQLDHNIPDRIFVPAGDGVIASGVYKGFEELLELGFIQHMPCIVIVQSANADNIIRNLNSPQFKARPCTTIADSISVDVPRNFYMIRDYIHKYNGEYVSVPDSEITEASAILSSGTGIFSEPAAAAAFAGMLAYKKQEKLKKNSKNVVLLTGSGLKDITSVMNFIKIPEAVNPEITTLNKYFNDKL